MKIRVINRADIKGDTNKDIFKAEPHHNHPIIDEAGTLRWEANSEVVRLVNKIGLNDLMALFHHLGYDKNCEVVRKMYRDIGYSLYGYWELFYWETNNEDALKYKPNQK